MPFNYVDTPATERDDVSLTNVPALDFSIVQPFASPSKNPAEDLRNKMRGLRAGNIQQPPVRTPRVRNVLVDRRNQTAANAKQEFTPLLKSAKRNELVRRSIIEEKENFLSSGVPDTPAAFRSSYIGDGTQLPLNSSVLDGENTSDSIAMAAAPQMGSAAVSSSMLSATPMPSLPRDGAGAVLDQGNILTLRDQEAKLDQIQKDNFGLKLKIHYLEEALRKTGSEFHQATLKENAELKTERATIEVELKRLRKRLQVVERELEEQRQRCAELSQSLQSKNADQHLARELAEMQKLAEARQKMADDRLEEIEELQQKLHEAQTQEHESQSDEVQDLKDDIEDLKREIRDRDNQLDSKDEEVDELKEKLNSAQSGSAELEHMQQDIDDLESELKQRDEELDVKNTKLAELEDRLNNVYDREKSTQKLRGDMVDLESDLREKNQELDEAREEMSDLKKRLAAAENTHQAELRRRDEEVVSVKAQLSSASEQASLTRNHEESLRDLQRQLADKDGELQALRERLDTARGSWDAEAQQVDARIQEKDRQIRDRDQRLREKIATIEQRDDELDDLQKRLRLAESSQGDAINSQSDKISLLTGQIRDLEQGAQAKEQSFKARLAEKDNLVQSRETELRGLQSRLDTAQISDNSTVQAQKETIQRLETTNRRLEKQIQDHLAHVTSLEQRAHAMETPSRKDALIKEYSEQVRSLREEMRGIEQSKDIELDGLEQELDRVEKENRDLKTKASSTDRLVLKVDELSNDKLDLQRRLDRMSEKAKAAEKDHSILGHHTDALGDQRLQISNLEREIDELKAKCLSHESNLRNELNSLQQRLMRDHNSARQALEDEVMVLEASLDEAESDRKSMSAHVDELESELQALQSARSQETPMKQRRQLRSDLTTITSERDNLARKIVDLERQLHETQLQKDEGVNDAGEHAAALQQLHSAESKMQEMQSQMILLEEELEMAREERTIADERQDLHDLVKSAKIEAEQLQIKLVESEKRLAARCEREREIRGQLEAALLDAEDGQLNMAELEARLNAHIKREKELRSQLKTYREAGIKIEELEMQLGDRKGSSTGHARREAELRTQLRDAKIGLESMQIELAEKEDRMLTLMKREHKLREQLKRARAATDDSINAQFDELQAQTDEAESNVQILQKQVMAREKQLKASQRQCEDLRSKLNGMDDCLKLDQLDIGQPQAKTTQQHLQEMKGLAKQIRFLQAKCSREERFRKDLVYTKRWFLMQVEMYNECNQAELRLLEDMGITPDQTIRENRPTLRSAGLAVMATIRMRRLSEDWQTKKKNQAALVHKLESMKRAKAAKSGR